MKHLRLFVAAIAAVFGLSSFAQTWTGSDPAEGTFFLYNVGTGKFINVGDKSAGWGTNAYLTAEYGLDIKFELNEGAYNLNTRICNGGSSNYLNTALWCDQGATPWTFTKVDRSDINAYTISNGEKYIVANEAGTDIVYAALSETERDQWQLIGSDDILANLQANTAEAVKRTVATFFISDPDFGRNDMRRPNWEWTNESGNVTVPGYGFNQGNQPNYGCEFWNNTFDIHQNITKLPKGIYEFEIYGYGTNGTTYIYATTGDGTTTEKVFKNQTSASNFQTALNNIDNYSGNATGLVQVGEDGKLTIGVKRTENKERDWTVIDQARLYYYGDYTFAECYGADLKDYIEEANGLVETGKYPTADLEAAIAAANTVMATGTTEAEFAAATEAIKEAIDTYKANNEAFIALHSRYTSVKEAVLAVNSAIDTSAADALDAAATTEEGIEAAVAAVRKALTDYLAAANIVDSKVDLTNALIDNPSPWATTDYWTCPVPASPNTSAKVAEFWMKDGVSISQVIANLPVGFYNLKAQAFARSGCEPIYIFANEDKQELIKKSSSEINDMAGAGAWFDSGEGWNTLIFEVTEAGNVTIGLNDEFIHGTVHGDGSDGWLIWRSFGLEYLGTNPVSAMTSEYEEALAAANAAKDNETYKNITGAELTALTNAINDKPQNTVASYKEKTEALIEATKAFTEPSVVSAYDAYAAEKAIAEMIGVTVAEGPANAAAATAGVENLKVAEFNFVETEYPYDYEPVIGTFGEWTGTATVGGQPAEPNYLSKEHWSGTTHAYYEQASNGWENTNGWTIKYEKTAKLPAGDYMLKVAARSSAGTTSLVSCTATENTVTLPANGAETRGINTSGIASWSDSDTFAQYDEDKRTVITIEGGSGFGWEWRFLPFTLTETTDVTMTFYAEANSLHQWMSIADGTLLSKQEIQNIVEIAGTDEAAPEAQVASQVITDRKLLAGLNTVIFPFETTKEELGATTVLEYTGTTVEIDGLTLNFKEVAPVDGVVTLQANTPYAVFVDADQEEDLTFGAKNINPGGGWYNECVTQDPNGQFDFRGTYCEFKKGEGAIVAGDYVAGAEKFVKAKGGNGLKAYRAYLQFVGNEESANVAFNFDGFVVDGIEAVELLNNLSGNIYNLNGQKLQKAQKGINIVNGKKVLVK